RLRRSPDKVEPARWISLRAGWQSGGRELFDPFRNLVTSVVAGERGAQRLCTLSVLRRGEHGADRLANLRGGWPAGPKIDAGARPRDARGNFRLFLTIPGDDQRHTETERVIDAAIAAIGHHDAHLR